MWRRVQRRGEKERYAGGTALGRADGLTGADKHMQMSSLKRMLTDVVQHQQVCSQITTSGM